MGRNVFVSYKYADSNVAPIGHAYYSTARDYVNYLEDLLTSNDHAYYGEREGEDLSYLTEDQIYEKLKDRIFPTSCTIVLISPEMRDQGKKDRYQWIPWEIYYSLRETTRANYTSRRNGILAVVLPDRNGNYNYALEDKRCCFTPCIKHHTEKLFTILKENMFNRINGDKRICYQNDTVWNGECSYIPMVKWCDFATNVDYFIEKAESIKDNAEAYDLHISVDA